MEIKTCPTNDFSICLSLRGNVMPYDNNMCVRLMVMCEITTGFCLVCLFVFCDCLRVLHFVLYVILFVSYMCVNLCYPTVVIHGRRNNTMISLYSCYVRKTTPHHIVVSYAIQHNMWCIYVYMYIYIYTLYIYIYIHV